MALLLFLISAHKDPKPQSNIFTKSQTLENVSPVSYISTITIEAFFETLEVSPDNVIFCFYRYEKYLINIEFSPPIWLA